MSMTQQELQEIQARAEAATAGPWGSRIDVGKQFYVFTPSYGVRDFSCLSGGFEHETDADFIAHARTDIPALLAENARLRAEFAEKNQTHQMSVNAGAAAIKQLQSELARVTAEKEAAVEDMTYIHFAGRRGCEICANNDVCKRQDSHIGKCDDFDWHGLKGEGKDE